MNKLSNEENKIRTKDLSVTNKSLKKKLSKKHYIIISIISFFIILLLIIFGFIFFNNSVIGSWAKGDSNINYVLTIKENGLAIVSKDDMSINGTYSLKENNIINFDIIINKKKFLVGDYKYRVISNFLEKKLELTNEDGTIEKYNQYKSTEPIVFNDFSIVEEILGRWKNENLNIEYEFLDNGLANVKKDNITINFIYKIKDQKIILKSKISGQEKESEVDYEINNGILKVGGVEYIKQ